MSETEIKSKCYSLATLLLLTNRKCNRGLSRGVSCESCHRQNLDCVIDEESDGRRKLFSKRKIESLEEDRALLIELVEKLHGSDETGLRNTIQIIREGASLAVLQKHLIDCRGLDCAKKSLASQYESNPGELRDFDTGSRREYLDVKSIIE